MKTSPMTGLLILASFACAFAGGTDGPPPVTRLALHALHPLANDGRETFACHVMIPNIGQSSAGVFYLNFREYLERSAGGNRTWVEVGLGNTFSSSDNSFIITSRFEIWRAGGIFQSSSGFGWEIWGDVEYYPQTKNWYGGLIPGLGLYGPCRLVIDSDFFQITEPFKAFYRVGPGLAFESASDNICLNVVVSYIFEYVAGRYDRNLRDECEAYPRFSLHFLFK